MFGYAFKGFKTVRAQPAGEVREVCLNELKLGQVVERDLLVEARVLRVHVGPELVGVLVQFLAVDADYALIVHPEGVGGRTFNDRTGVFPRWVGPFL